MSDSKTQLAGRLVDLAGRGVFVGTSSWKYPGWCGALYDRARYEYRGKFAETRLNRKPSTARGILPTAGSPARRPPLGWR